MLRVPSARSSLYQRLANFFIFKKIPPSCAEHDDGPLILACSKKGTVERKSFLLLHLVTYDSRE